MEIVMRKVFLALVFATVGISTLGASADPAAAWRSYRWYRDYAPLYPRAYYGPPRVYVVPPAYARYPAPLYRYCPPGYVVGPEGHVYPRRYSYPRNVRRYPRGYWRRGRR
jgi:hypothetical protein